MSGSDIEGGEGTVSKVWQCVHCEEELPLTRNGKLPKYCMYCGKSQVTCTNPGCREQLTSVETKHCRKCTTGINPQITDASPETSAAPYVAGSLDSRSGLAAVSSQQQPRDVQLIEGTLDTPRDSVSPAPDERSSDMHPHEEVSLPSLKDKDSSERDKHPSQQQPRDVQLTEDTLDTPKESVSPADDNRSSDIHPHKEVSLAFVKEKDSKGDEHPSLQQPLNVQLIESTLDTPKESVSPAPDERSSDMHPHEEVSLPSLKDKNSFEDEHPSQQQPRDVQLTEDTLDTPKESVSPAADERSSDMYPHEEVYFASVKEKDSEENEHPSLKQSRNVQLIKDTFDTPKESVPPAGDKCVSEHHRDMRLDEEVSLPSLKDKDSSEGDEHPLQQEPCNIQLTENTLDTPKESVSPTVDERSFEQHFDMYPHEEVSLASVKEKDSKEDKHPSQQQPRDVQLIEDTPREIVSPATDECFSEMHPHEDVSLASLKDKNSSEVDKHPSQQQSRYVQLTDDTLDTTKESVSPAADECFSEQHRDIHPHEEVSLASVKEKDSKVDKHSSQQQPCDVQLIKDTLDTPKKNVSPAPDERSSDMHPHEEVSLPSLKDKNSFEDEHPSQQQPRDVQLTEDTLDTPKESVSPAADERSSDMYPHEEVYFASVKEKDSEENEHPSLKQSRNVQLIKDTFDTPKESVPPAGDKCVSEHHRDMRLDEEVSLPSLKDKDSSEGDEHPLQQEPCNIQLTENTLDTPKESVSPTVDERSFEQHFDMYPHEEVSLASVKEKDSKEDKHPSQQQPRDVQLIEDTPREIVSPATDECFSEMHPHEDVSLASLKDKNSSEVDKHPSQQQPRYLHLTDDTLDTTKESVSPAADECFSEQHRDIHPHEEVSLASVKEKDSKGDEHPSLQQPLNVQLIESTLDTPKESVSPAPDERSSDMHPHEEVSLPSLKDKNSFEDEHLSQQQPRDVQLTEDTLDTPKESVSPAADERSSDMYPHEEVYFASVKEKDSEENEHPSLKQSRNVQLIKDTFDTPKESVPPAGDKCVSEHHRDMRLDEEVSLPSLKDKDSSEGDEHPLQQEPCNIQLTENTLDTPKESVSPTVDERSFEQHFDMYPHEEVSLASVKEKDSKEDKHPSQQQPRDVQLIEDTPREIVSPATDECFSEMHPHEDVSLASLKDKNSSEVDKHPSQQQPRYVQLTDDTLDTTKESVSPAADECFSEQHRDIHPHEEVSLASVKEKDSKVDKHSSQQQPCDVQLIKDTLDTPKKNVSPAADEHSSDMHPDEEVSLTSLKDKDSSEGDELLSQQPPRDIQLIESTLDTPKESVSPAADESSSERHQDVHPHEDVSSASVKEKNSSRIAEQISQEHPRTVNVTQSSSDFANEMQLSKSLPSPPFTTLSPFEALPLSYRSKSVDHKLEGIEVSNRQNIASLNPKDSLVSDAPGSRSSDTESSSDDDSYHTPPELESQLAQQGGNPSPNTMRVVDVADIHRGEEHQYDGDHVRKNLQATQNGKGIESDVDPCSKATSQVLL